MHERYRNNNIPIELLRTLVMITETHSFTKAANKLALSQPAISAQIRRLQSIVGGALFEKSNGGIALNARGRLVIGQVQRLLDANDRILSLASPAHQPRPLRLGVANFYADAFIERLNREDCRRFRLYCDPSEEIGRGIVDGYIDIGCALFPSPPTRNALKSWNENLVWVRSRDFLLSPGAPVPLVAWPGIPSDCAGMQALEKAGARFEIVCASGDHRSRLAAVAAGLGVMVLAERMVPQSVMVARDYYLPALPPMPAGLFLRDGLDVEEVNPVRRQLAMLVPAAIQSSFAGAGEEAETKAETKAETRADARSHAKGYAKGEAAARDKDWPPSGGNADDSAQDSKRRKPRGASGRRGVSAG
jgi:DNA-binding transcriptional LysR family regulator